MKIDARVLVELSDVQAWASTSASSITLLDYVGFVGTPDLLFGFAELFAPETVEHAGRRFLGSGFRVDLYDAWLAKGLSGPAIQRMINQVHVSALLQNQHVNSTVAVAAAETVAALWRRTLGEAIVVEAGGTGLHDAYVTFFDRE